MSYMLMVSQIIGLDMKRTLDTFQIEEDIFFVLIFSCNLFFFFQQKSFSLRSFFFLALLSNLEMDILLVIYTLGRLNILA